MTEVDGARSAGKTWCVVLVLMALIAVGFAAALAVWPDLLPLGSGRIVGQVSIAPQEAAQAGGQWRVVSQWQAAGEMRDGDVDEQPLVEPQVSHFRQVPLRTRVRCPQAGQGSPS